MGTVDTYLSRRNQLRENIQSGNIQSKNVPDAVLIFGLSSIRYFSGFSGSNALLWIDGSDAARDVLITDGRYTTQARGECPGLTIDIQSSRGSAALCATAAERGLHADTLGVDGEFLNWLDYQEIAAWLNTENSGGVDSTTILAQLVDISPQIAQLRAVKDSAEIVALDKAARCAEAALCDLIDEKILVPGVTENEVAARLDYLMKIHGSECVSFETIVGTGANGALPHHSPDGTQISAGDLVVIDFGAVVDGYHSDCTHTFCIGDPQPWQKEISDIVWQAHQAAVAAVVPGITAGSIDDAARAIITDAGYRECFGHSTGHGVGIDIHEHPWVRTGSQESIVPGTVFTVEPGIYLPDRGGVRIENTYVLEEDGNVRSLQAFSAELLLV